MIILFQQLSVKVLPSLVWGLVILVLCLLPSSNLPEPSFFETIPYFDKLVHFGLFFIWMLCLQLAMSHEVWRNVFICVVYGILIEYLQDWLPTGRDSEIVDVFADVFGATFAALVMLGWRYRRLI